MSDTENFDELDELDELDDASESEEFDLDENEEFEADDDSEDTDGEDEDGEQSEDESDSEDTDGEEESEAVDGEAEGEASDDTGASSDAEPPAPKTAAGLERYKELNERARKIFKARFETEYDEFDDVHREAMTEVKQVIREAERLDAFEREIVQRNGGEKFAVFLQEQVDNLTVKEHKAFEAAAARGDFSAARKFVKDVENKFKTRDKARAKAQALNSQSASGKTAPKPPRTMSSGTGSNPASRSNPKVLTPEDLGF